MSGGALDRRLAALAETADLADGRLDAQAVAAARAVVRQAGERLGHGLEATVVALAGPTGAGKSTLFNALAGADLVTAGVRRPTTSHATAAVWGQAPSGHGVAVGGQAPSGQAPSGLLDWLEIPERHFLNSGAPAGLVLLDLPDFDSVETANRAEAERLVRLVDLLVWVADPQKYADASLHEGYLRPLAAHAPAMLVVLNQADRLGTGVDAARRDLARLLEAEGLHDVPVLAVSGLTGDGIPELRRALEDRVRRREAALARLGADVASAAGALAAQVGDRKAGSVGRAQRDQLISALSVAAGLPAVLAAVGRAHRRRGALATGVPWFAWLRRLRPDPLRRLGLGDKPQEEVRTSLPRATPVQGAQVDSAARSIAGDAAAALPEPWPELARRAATSNEDRVAEALDRAVAGADLHMRAPRWWTSARLLQRALALATAAGALWLVAIAALGYLQLDDVIPTPEVDGFPLPTALLLGGLLLSLLVAFVLRLVNGAGARRRVARARRALHARVREVGDELVLKPLIAELAAHDELRERLRGLV
jgi:GTP-binding protein EngB required for normal cell division